MRHATPNLNLKIRRMRVKEYLGDGVYAEYDHSAEHIILTSEDGVSVQNVIYMDSWIQSKLMHYIKQVGAKNVP